jgi:hypothetical protein
MPGQLSLVITEAGLETGTKLAHETVTGAGQVMLGACESLTFTVKVQLAVFPFTSVAVAVTVVVPTGKVEPDNGRYVIVDTAQLSVAVAV